MRFSLLTVAVAALAGVVNGQSSSSRASSVAGQVSGGGALSAATAGSVATGAGRTTAAPRPTMSTSTHATTTNTFSSISFYNSRANVLCLSYGLAIPKCGTGVLQSLASSIGGCNLVDFNCQCHYSTIVQPLASSGIIESCGGLQAALTVQGAADRLCECVAANNAPVNATATSTGAGVPIVGRAAPTDARGLLVGFGGAVAAAVGALIAL